MDTQFENKPIGLRRADENDVYAKNVDQCCDKCKYFSTVPLACPSGWCGKYPSQRVNCDIGHVCDFFKPRG